MTALANNLSRETSEWQRCSKKYQVPSEVLVEPGHSAASEAISLL